MVQMSHVAVVLGLLSVAHVCPKTTAMKSFDMQKPGARVNATNAACDGSSLTASVIRPGDSNYDSSRSQFASVSATAAIADSRLQPSMIIICATDTHVQEAVALAKTCGFEITVRSGGHNYAALSSCPEGSPQCIQVDLSGIKTLLVDHTVTPKLATVGSGLRVEEVNAFMEPLGLTVVSGTCHKVGVGGHFQTSAASYLSKAFGLGLDMVKSMRVVLADGQVHTVNESTDPDLYWALLGGGPGSFGIVLDYTIETFADADYPHAASFTYLYPWNRALFIALANAVSSATFDPINERDMLYYLIVHPGILYGIPGSTDEHYIAVRGAYVGIDNGALSGVAYDKLVKPFDDIPHMTFMPLTPLPLSMMQGTLGTNWDLGPLRYHIHGLSLQGVSDATFLEQAADEVETRVAIPNLHFSLQFWSFGGSGAGSAIQRNVGKIAYSPSIRAANFWMDDWVFFLGDSLAQTAEDRIIAFRNSTGHAWEEHNIAHSYMTPDTRTRDNYNVVDAFSTTPGRMDRLQDVKTRVDPTDIFHTSLTIPPRSSAPSAVGDPHLQNMHGERFDLMQPGVHALLEIPRRAAAKSVLLLVVAEARHDGLACADIYFQSLNVTGQWPEAETKGGLRFRAQDATNALPKWMSFGGVSLKVAHGHTQQGTRYLNLYVKHLSKTGFAVGGLLGEDDHEVAATPLTSCQQRLSLLSADVSPRAASMAEASLE